MKTFFILLLLVALCSSVSLKYLGSFKTPNPAFLKLTKIRPNSPYSLLMSSFTVDPRKWGSIRIIENIGAYINNFNQVRIKEVASKNLYWPNEVGMVPEGTFEESYMWTADGFLVPGKSTGGIHLIKINRNGTFSETFELSTKKSGWFYHQAKWIDMNGDGKLDVITARAYKPLWGQDKGELVWFENPGQGFDKKKWKEHMIESGPDVSFDVDHLIKDQPNKIHIIATEFFGKRISLTAMEIGKPEPKLVYHRMIDNTIGSAYHIEIVDLNNNGKKSLLVSNHETKAENGAVFVYDIPENLRSGTFKKHVVANDFKIRGRGFNEAVPGFAYSLYPNVNQTLGMKHIVVAGDGSHQAYLLSPEKPYQYSKSVMRNVGGTCGSLAFADIDGDGWKEIFIPNYDKGEVFVYKFQK
jgi:hypothetical protein